MENKFRFVIVYQWTNVRHEETVSVAGFNTYAEAVTYANMLAATMLPTVFRVHDAETDSVVHETPKGN